VGTFVDIASAILTDAERRVEVSAQNIANLSTPGYKRLSSFRTAAGNIETGGVDGYASDFTPGKPINTGNPYNLAILSQGFFEVSTPSGLLYTRDGQFQRNADGRLLTTQGYVLQASGGGDLVLEGDTFQVQPDGVVVEDGEATTKVAVVTFAPGEAASYADGGFFSAPQGSVTEVDAPLIQQGVLESSNVSTGAEMIAMMAALRSAETGQKLVNVYDDLMGRVLGAFDQGS
jgi:flagellar basal-body rod protein FlgG